MPHARAAFRSKLCVATIMISSGLSCRNLATLLYDSGTTLYLPMPSQLKTASHESLLAVAVSMMSRYDNRVKEQTMYFLRSSGSTAARRKVGPAPQ